MHQPLPLDVQVQAQLKKKRERASERERPRLTHAHQVQVQVALPEALARATRLSIWPMRHQMTDAGTLAHGWVPAWVGGG